MGRYDNLNIQNKTGKGLVYHSQLLPYIEPTDSDILIVTEEEDRLDLLANQFYGDSQLWWVIATYNNLTDIDTKLEPGLQLRIPVRETIVTQLF
jgi:nucleoid-associated protein YgaU